MPGRGYIRKRGRSWEITVELASRDANGRRARKTVAVRGVKRDAQRKLSEILHALDAGSYVEPSRTTVGEYLDQWLRDYARTHVAPRTYQRYEEIVQLHLKPALGRYQISKLHPVHIQGYYTEALSSGHRKGKGGLSSTTVLQHHRVLREALKHALRLELIARNPADAAQSPRAAKREMQVLDDAETKQVLRVAQGTRLSIPILLAVGTGMRRGEILGLRWKDIDLEAATAAVVRSLEVTREGLRYKEPKSSRSRRRIDLSRFLVEALRRHRVEQARERLRLGQVYQNNDLVCAAPDGRPWNPDSLSSAFRKFLLRQKLPLIRFHDLRHTHATSLFRQNIHPKIVSERLGHANVSITLDTYSHVLPGMQREAAEKLDEVLGALE